MPRISYNPDKIVTPEVRVPNAGPSGAKGIAQVGRANNELLETAQKGVMSLAQMDKKRRLEILEADLAAGDSIASELDIKRRSEIDSIPVDNGVDFDKEVDKINQKYNNEWKNWTQKNIRNQKYFYVQERVEQSNEAFKGVGNEYAAKSSESWNKNLNLSNLNIAEGTAIKNRNLDKIRQVQRMKTQQGFQTNGEEAENIRQLKEQFKKEEDGQKLAEAENLVFDGDYGEAERRINKLSDQYTEADRTRAKNKLFASATYNRFNASINDIDTISEFEEYQKQVEENEYLSDDIHKSILRNRANKGIKAIQKQQIRNTKDFVDQAQDGELDLDAWEQTEGLDDTVNGIYGDRKQIEEVLIETQKVFEAEEQIESDQKEFKQASKNSDRGGVDRVHDEYQDLLRFQLEGSMELQEVEKRIQKYDEWKNEGKVSPAIHRQLQRELVKGLSSALEDDQIHRDVSIWKRGKDLPEAEVKAYQGATEAFRFQNEKVGKFIDFAEDYEWVQREVNDFIQANPNPDSDKLNSFIDEIKGVIRTKAYLEIIRTGRK